MIDYNDPKINNFFLAARKEYGDTDTTRSIHINKDRIKDIVEKYGLPYPYWLINTPTFRVSRGLYVVPPVTNMVYNVFAKERKELYQDEGGEGGLSTPTMMNSSLQTVSSAGIDGEKTVIPQRLDPVLNSSLGVSVPSKFIGYVPFGEYTTIENVIKAGAFYPIFITGLSGNGKTLMVEEICARNDRGCLRINISIETDQIDLIGGPSLENGNMITRDGPVLVAMKTGSILLLDEIDRGSNKLMCLQAILEGKPYYNKNNGEIIHPAPGFNIIATANSNGRGSEDGKYLSQILDDAFLERFPITIHQEFPDKRVELKILVHTFSNSNIEKSVVTKFVENLVIWAANIRSTYNKGGIEETISTRRLVHICKAYDIFRNKETAVTLCINRFDENVREAFWQFYKNIDPNIEDVVDPAPANLENVSPIPVGWDPDTCEPFSMVENIIIPSN